MTVQRAKWMNDSWRNVTVSFGKLRVRKKRTGRNTRPQSLIVLKTVIAIAWPSALRDAVPVAVIGLAGVALALTSATYVTDRTVVKGRNGRPSGHAERPLFGPSRRS